MNAFVRMTMSLAALTTSIFPAFAGEKLRVDMATEHKVFSGYLLPGQEVCLEFKDADRGGFANAHLRRTSNGDNKDLANAFGGRCLKMNNALGGLYVVYASPVDVPLLVEVLSYPDNPVNIPIYRESGAASRSRLGL